MLPALLRIVLSFTSLLGVQDDFTLTAKISAFIKVSIDYIIVYRLMIQVSNLALGEGCFRNIRFGLECDLRSHSVYCYEIRVGIPERYCLGMAIAYKNEVIASRSLQLSGLYYAKAGLISAVLNSKSQFTMLVCSQKCNLPKVLGLKL